MEKVVIVEKKQEKIVYLFVKRFFDIIISLIGLLILLIIMVIVKLVSILNKDYDSIFYSQDRIGKNGKEFKLYKFRSMIPDADEVLEKLIKDNKEIKKEYDLNKKIHNDPRITKIGKILRKTSIDELPQLLNVFKGDMSLIGNRPYMTKEKKDMGTYYDNIIKTKPGISGYWQVNGRSNTTFVNRLKMEEWYSLNNNLLLDIKIFIKTILVVLIKKDAM